MTNEIEKRRLTRLNEKLNKLQDELCKEVNSVQNLDELVKQIKELETEKKTLEKKAILKKVNEEHTKKRNMLIELMKINFPDYDITTNSGEFHATKVKNIPILNELCKNGYVTAEINTQPSDTNPNGSIIYEAIRIGGERYRLVNYKYEAYKCTMSYFNTLEEALNMNGIKAEPVKFSEYTKAERVATKEREKLEKYLKEMDEKLKAVDIYFFESNNMLRRGQERGYTYTA
jgi:hypothetical protein